MILIFGRLGLLMRPKVGKEKNLNPKMTFGDSQVASTAAQICTGGQGWPH